MMMMKMMDEVDRMGVAVMASVGAVLPPLMVVLLVMCVLLMLVSMMLFAMLRAAWRKKSPRNREEDWVDIKKRVIFVHPDLGVGGAERLVVDAAVELVNRGYVVNIYTAFHSEERCFPETLTGGFGVYVHGTCGDRKFNTHTQRERESSVAGFRSDSRACIHTASTSKEAAMQDMSSS